MPIIHLSTQIYAPKQLVFDLSRDIDLHQESTKHTGERAIAGKTSGLIGLGESVTWRAKHFGIWQNLTSKITEMDHPHYFVDEMQQGAFKSFRHEHVFEEVNRDTLMTDRFDFESPLGWLGKLANELFLTKYMTKLLIIRNEIIKKVAEETAGQLS